MIVDCILEDKIRGYSDDYINNGHFKPLKSCLKCLQLDENFIFCSTCSDKLLVEDSKGGSFEISKEKKRHTIKDFPLNLTSSERVSTNFF